MSYLKKSDVTLSWILPMEDGNIDETFFENFPLTHYPWFNDPAQQESVEVVRERIRWLKERGVRKVNPSFSLIIRPAPSTLAGKAILADEELEKAVMYDIEGNRIPIPWWPVVYDGGHRAYWGCTNNPRYRDLLRKRAMWIAELDPDGIQVDGHNGTMQAIFSYERGHGRITVASAGCLCDYCAGGFRDHLTAKYNAEELAALGIERPDEFDYRELVKTVATTKEEFEVAYQQGRIPMLEEYIGYQLHSTKALLDELLLSIRAACGRKIPISINGFNFEAGNNIDLHLTDHVSMEISHSTMPGGVSVLPYKIAESIDRQVSTYPFGPDGEYVAERERNNLLRLWIALGYALGGNPAVPHRLWTGTNSKTATVYLPPYDKISPLYHFVQKHQDLFDDYFGVEQVGIIHSDLSWRRDMQSRTLADKQCSETAAADIGYRLLDANVPFGVTVAGNDWLHLEMNTEQLRRFEQVILPATAILSDDQRKILQHTSSGKIILWKDEEDLARVLDRIVPLVHLEGEKFWAIPRKKKEDASAPVIIQLVNGNYDESADKLLAQPATTLSLQARLFGCKSIKTATLFMPDRAPMNVNARRTDDSYRIELPEGIDWGIIQLCI